MSSHEVERALGDGKGQGSLVCCSPWDHKESDMTEQEPQQEDSLLDDVISVLFHLFTHDAQIHVYI